MCTLTWWATADGYELFFNRDELRTRPAAEPPRRDESRGVAYLASNDPVAGGTWLAVNELGVSVALLNAYDKPRAVDGPVLSRGELVRRLAGAPDATAAIADLEALDLSPYPPCTIALFDRGVGPVTGAPEFVDRSVRGPEAPGRSLLVRAWDGTRLGAARVGTLPFLSSTSWRSDEVIAARGEALRAALDGGGDAPERLLDFHRLHLPQGRAWSPCMHRDRSVTTSLSRIRVRGSLVELGYAAGSPCERGAFVAASISLARRADAGLTD